MQLRLRTQRDVRVFALVITLIALVGNFILTYLFMPHSLADLTLLPGTIITMILAAPISFFVGTKMLDVHHLTEQLEHAADHDPLTGVHTRLSFYKEIADCVDMKLAIIVADIDHFKLVNDRYGHQAGDAALKSFAATLIRHCRDNDIIARFGGEEFVILLKHADQSDTVKAAERLSQKVRETPLHLKGRYIQLTASFGVAQVDSVAHVDRAIHHADMAVYRAKSTGRDRVCAYDPRLDIEPASRHAETRMAAMPAP